MHDHGRILELAAAAIDFELDPAERAELTAALETCQLCRRQASAMRATATILGRASDIGTPSQVRDVVVGAALRGGNRSSGWRPLLAASLSLLVVLGGVAAFVGSRGPTVGPSTSPGASPGHSALAIASPTASPAVDSPAPTPLSSPLPSETATPSGSATPDASGPLRAGDIAAMVTDGRLVIRTEPGTGPQSAIYGTRLYPGQRMLVLEGPIEGSGYPWFRVRLGGIEGWVAGSSLSGEQWLAPVRNGLIAFVRNADDGSGEAIYTIPADATSAEKLLLADARLTHYAQLTWSPDGRRLAFVGTLIDAVNGTAEIFVVDADGSNLVRITQNDVDDYSPAWSPDSARIAFGETGPDAAAPDVSNVVVAAVDGSGTTVLGPGENPVWSPDGQQLAMTVSYHGVSNLWVEAPGGGSRRQVTDVPVTDARPAWSPDGQRLLFSSSGLYLVDVSGGAATPFETEPGTEPAWTASGTIAYSAGGPGAPELVVIGSDGRNARRLSGDPAFAAAPAWSPDGHLLLLGADVPGRGFAIADPDRASLTAVIESATSRAPAWQPQLP